MDAFFASIEQRDHPELRGKPVVVGGSKTGRGVVAAASYEARKFGVHSAMSGYRAAQLCPEAIFVKCDHSKYSLVGRQVREILQRFSPIIQPLSCDEAFLDMTGTLRHFTSIEAVAKEIKSTIRNELNLTASVGAAPLKFIAKIASDFDKPDGCIVLNSEQMQAFLDPLPIGRLWGVGQVAEKKLHRYGVKTIGDLRSLSESTIALLGDWCNHLYQLANCIDPRPVVTDHQAKQVSHERTFAEDINDLNVLLSVANYLTDQVCRRLRHSQRRGRCVSIKYRTNDFATYNRSKTIHVDSDGFDDFWPEVTQLLATVFHSNRKPVRLIGIGVSELTEPNAPRQLQLFDQESFEHNRKLESITDDIVKKLGDRAVYRGTAHTYISKKYIDHSTHRNPPE